MSSANELRQEIERELRNSIGNRFAEERDNYYPTLRRQLTDMTVRDVSSQTDAYTWILQRIYFALRWHASEAGLSLARDKSLRQQAYRVKVQRARRAIELLKLRHPIIEDLQPTFRTSDEPCPHGRTRSECESFWSRLEQIKLIEQAGSVSRLLKTRLADLKRGLPDDALVSPLGNLCAPSLPPVFAVKGPGGRDRDNLNEDLTGHIVKLFTQNERTVRDGSRCVQQILRLFFNERTGVEAIERRWYRIKSTAH